LAVSYSLRLFGFYQQFVDNLLSSPSPPSSTEIEQSESDFFFFSFFTADNENKGSWWLTPSLSIICADQSFGAMGPVRREVAQYAQHV
jgi:hypothetical protein